VKSHPLDALLEETESNMLKADSWNKNKKPNLRVKESWAKKYCL